MNLKGEIYHVMKNFVIYVRLPVLLRLLNEYDGLNGKIELIKEGT